MRLKKRKIRHDLKALREREKGGGWADLRPRDRAIYETVTQHYGVTTSGQSSTRLMNTAGPCCRPCSRKATVGEFH